MEWDSALTGGLQMGGPMPGGRALEIGCGRGVGTELILEVFKAHRVDAFDLDLRMVALARKRLARRSTMSNEEVAPAASAERVMHKRRYN